jgi:hypothetical protein
VKLALALVLAACGSPSPASSSSSAVPSSPAPAPVATPAPPPEKLWPVPAGWRSEVIPFPFEFAPAIPHRGLEDLRFPPGMFDPSSPDYWSYAFTWHTDDAAELDASALGLELTAYFAGLIAAVDTKGRIAAADRERIAVRATPTGNGRFAITAQVYDAFKTAAAVDLEGTATRRACGTGALWTFVLARPATATRAKLDELAAQSSCVRPKKP